MESTRVLIATIVSFASLLGLVLGGVVAWVKFCSMVEQNKKILCGYKNKDGSPIFRTEEDCTMIHHDLIKVTTKKIDEIKKEIEKSTVAAQGTREELWADVRENRKTVSDMFLEIKEFMGSTTTAINSLERRRTDS